MRVSLRLLALVLLGAFLASCSTMMAFEEQRLAKRGTSPSSSPSAAGATGTILQPFIPKAKVDEAAIQAEKSVRAAEKSLAETDPSVVTGVAAGPTVPELKSLLATKADIEAVAKSYAAYAQAVADVRVSLGAHGLKPNLESLRRVREASDYWRLYLPQLRIRPMDTTVSRDDINGLYAVFSVSGRQLQVALQDINQYIDSHRTKAWAVSNPSS